MDADADCPCTPAEKQLEQPNLEQPNFELDEMLLVQDQFASDLEAVFAGKELEFSDHLRGMLLELWSRARGSCSSIVKELEHLRQLKAERLDLKEMVAELLKRGYRGSLGGRRPSAPCWC